ncbi:hypothetical protein KKH82_00620 [Patescibacteria group bacterium]|nr:hypothetical protein [Patescibacteria group bacterium]
MKSCDASEYDEVSTYINDPANGYDLTGYLWLATPPTTDADYGLEY